jgi:hypothetical protein
LTTLEASGGSTSKAASILGISSRKIQYKLREYASGRLPEPSLAEGEGRDSRDSVVFGLGRDEG